MFARTASSASPAFSEGELSRSTSPAAPAPPPAPAPAPPATSSSSSSSSALVVIDVFVHHVRFLSPPAGGGTRPDAQQQRESRGERKDLWREQREEQRRAVRLLDVRIHQQRRDPADACPQHTADERDDRRFDDDGPYHGGAGDAHQPQRRDVTATFLDAQQEEAQQKDGTGHHRDDADGGVKPLHHAEVQDATYKKYELGSHCLYQNRGTGSRDFFKKRALVWFNRKTLAGCVWET